MTDLQILGEFEYILVAKIKERIIQDKAASGWEEAADFFEDADDYYIEETVRNTITAMIDEVFFSSQ